MSRFRPAAGAVLRDLPTSSAESLAQVGGRSSVALLLGCVLLSAVACVELVPEEDEEGAGGEGSDGGGGGGGGEGEPVEPGSCNAWKVSYCDAVARCSFSSRRECELDVGYVMCLDDAPVAECAEAIDKAACAAMPSACDPADIADRSLPTEVCVSLQSEICEWSLVCGYEFSLEGCRNNLAVVQPCGEFTAVLPGYEECLADYRALPCNSVLPPSCEGLLRR